MGRRRARHHGEVGPRAERFAELEDEAQVGGRGVGPPARTQHEVLARRAERAQVVEMAPGDRAVADDERAHRAHPRRRDAPTF
jgi:hypothetical protein